MTAPKAKSAAPAEALVERFKEALARLWPEGGKLGLAVSGGPDSLAMMLLAEAAIPGQFEVATVDHGLRPEAADECAMVARVCAERGIACEVLAVSVQPGNIQAQARDARYYALAQWAASRDIAAVATAHHADDQTETLLMRLNRASGLSGLAGVRAKSHLSGTELTLIRPLLRFRRAELADVVEEQGLIAADDPSNENTAFDRVRIRKAIADADWIDPLAVARSAELLGEAKAALDFAILQQWSRAVVPDDDGIRCFVDAAELDRTPRTLVIGVLSSIFAYFDATPADSDLARTMDELLADRRINVSGVQATPGTVAGERVWLFAPEKPRRTN